MNLNLHHHALVPDGIFVAPEDGAVRFEKLARPGCAELERILARIVRRTLTLVERLGLREAEPDDALSGLQVEAVQGHFGFALSKSQPKLSTFLEGFSLEAGRHLHAHDRQGLEALCRYALRPPLAISRLSEAADGRVVLRLRRPAHDGTVAIAFTPLELSRRLAALVPPSRAHLVRYFGVFAPGSKLRARARARSRSGVGNHAKSKRLQPRLDFAAGLGSAATHRDGPPARASTPRLPLVASTLGMTGAQPQVARRDSHEVWRARNAAPS